MWFAFGLVTFIGFVLVVAYRRAEARWSGAPLRAAGVAYEYQEYVHKDKALWFRIGVPAPAGFDFALKPETPVDTFFKGIGISCEHQLADAAFDKAIYIVSDDAGLCRKLAASPELRAEILALFEDHGDRPYEIEGVRCCAGRIWLRCAVRGSFASADAHKLAEKAVPVLRRMARALAAIPAEAASRWRDPFVPKAILILSLSSGLAITGGIHLFRVHWTDFPVTVDPWALAGPSIIVGLCISALLATATIFFLGRSARMHFVLLEILLVGSFGAVSTAFTELRDVNMEWDRQPARSYEVMVVDKTTHRGRRYIRTRYYIHVQDWSARGTREIRVPSDAYHRLQRQDRVTLYVKPGYLGFRWVESMTGPGGVNVQ